MDMDMDMIMVMDMDMVMVMVMIFHNEGFSHGREVSGYLAYSL